MEFEYNIGLKDTWLEFRFNQWQEANPRNTTPVSDYYAFYSINSNPKEYEDAHGWEGNVSFPKK